MSELRNARERAGLTLEQMYERTRIQVKYLDALERGDFAALPAGPYRSGFTAKYRAALGLVAGDASSAPQPVRRSPAEGKVRPPMEEPEQVGEAHRVEEPTLTAPKVRIRRAGRMAALGTGVAVLALVALWFLVGPRQAPTEGVDIPPDQVLLVTSASGVHVRVEADGRELYDRDMPPGRQMKFAAHDRLSVELDALDGVTLVYNGHSFKPLGAQSRSRRLVFVDDHGG